MAVKAFTDWLAEDKQSQPITNDTSILVRKILDELDSRNLDYILLSNPTQLKNGNIFIEWRGGKSAETLLKNTLSYYNVPADFIKSPNPRGETLDSIELNTGTPYQISVAGFMKHNTGPRKIPFDVTSDIGIKTELIGL